LKQLLASTATISVVFDGWTSRAADHYIGVIVRFFDHSTTKVKQLFYDLHYCGVRAESGANIAAELEE
jgi:hypothetical protein